MGWLAVGVFGSSLSAACAVARAMTGEVGWAAAYTGIAVFFAWVVVIWLADWMRVKA